MSNPGDDLWQFIRFTVHGRVPPGLENEVSEAVARTVIELMSRPDFYNHLLVVQNLQAQVVSLQRQVLALQAQLGQAPVRVKKAPAKKVARKAPPRPQTRAFKRGASGR